MNFKLSDRVRPNSECAPWVIEEIKVMEGKIESLQHWINHYKNTIPMGENKLIEENYNLRLSLDNWKEVFDTKIRVHDRLNKDYLELKKEFKSLVNTLEYRTEYFEKILDKYKQELDNIK